MKEFLSNVIRTVEVMDLEAFKARFANPVRDILGEDFKKLESFAQIFPSDYYFFR